MTRAKSNSLDIDFIHGHIHDRSCTNGGKSLRFDVIMEYVMTGLARSDSGSIGPIPAQLGAHGMWTGIPGDYCRENAKQYNKFIDIYGLCLMFTENGDQSIYMINVIYVGYSTTNNII